MKVKLLFIKNWRCSRRLFSACALSLFAAHALAQPVNDLAPTGTLRAAINLGNPILASRDVSTGQVQGVSIDLAQELARRLGVKLEMVVVEAAGKSVETVNAGIADIGFFAVDPVRAQGLLFTAPYLLIEGSYLVREDSPLVRNEDVDVKGNRVVVGQASAYDLYLSRSIQQATLVRAPTSPSVVDMMTSLNFEVAAGVKQQLQADAQRLGGLRLLPGRFMVIEQAIGISSKRSTESVAYLRQFITSMRQSDMIQKSLERHHIQGATVAKP